MAHSVLTYVLAGMFGHQYKKRFINVVPNFILYVDYKDKQRTSTIQCTLMETGASKNIFCMKHSALVLTE